jgi:hypothetical protein
MSNIPAYFKFILDRSSDFNDSIYDASELYKMSLQYAKNNKMTSTYSERLFFLQFKKVFGKFNILNKENNRSQYVFPSDFDEIANDMIYKYLFGDQVVKKEELEEIKEVTTKKKPKINKCDKFMFN